LLAADEKEEIFGWPTKTPNDSVFDASLGIPLFWQERKTKSFWGPGFSVTSEATPFFTSRRVPARLRARAWSEASLTQTFSGAPIPRLGW
jgi:hypothetical protein